MLHNINPALAHTEHAISPAMLSAPPVTPGGSAVKKERKRKSKDEPVATAVTPVADKKVRRKSCPSGYCANGQKKKKTKE